jgi:hypothetical protein
VARALATHLRADRFERWLLAEALDALVAGASRILRELSGGQYDLGHSKGEFYVVDHHDAGLRRAVRTLSGGETFQASLALALALSEQLAGMSAGAASLESIVLDEGFGTLDAATLDTVAATLENLAARGDRMVGVVTHVRALAERIPVRFEVSRDARTARVERTSVMTRVASGRSGAEPAVKRPAQMQLFVDAWDPSYGAGCGDGDFVSGAGASEARLELDVERDPAVWEPISPPPDVRAADVALLVDGVRRTDAPGLGRRRQPTSTRAGRLVRGRRGAVRPAPGHGRGDHRPGRTGRVHAVHRVRRHRDVGRPLSGAGREERRTAGPVGRSAAAVAGPGVGGARRVARRVDADELLVADGPLRGRAGISRVLGYIKSHEKPYLKPPQSTVSRRCAPASAPRCSSSARAGSVHLVPAPARPERAPWSTSPGIECSVELPPQAAIALADLSMITLPRFAATAYKDPRAPQNLVPIAGLERRLRGMLGDGRLLHRALTLAAHRVPPVSEPSPFAFPTGTTSAGRSAGWP